MKRNLIFAIFIVAAFIAFVGCNSKKASESNEMSSSGSAADVSDDSEAADTIFHSGSGVVAASYQLVDGGQGSRLLIVRNNGSQSDTTVVRGFYNTPEADGDLIVFVNGIDTARYDADTLGAEITPLNKMMLQNVGKVTASRNFSVDDGESVCSYDVTIYHRHNSGAEMTRLLSQTLQLNFDAMMFDSLSYSRVTPDMTIKQAADFVGEEFEDAYRKEFTGADYVAPYSFDALYYPEWESADGRYVTYFLSSDLYFGGAHGMNGALYVTFDSNSGKSLGVSDIFTPSGFEKAMEILASKVKDYTSGRVTTAYLITDSETVSEYYQMHDGRIYPRPALTRHGVAFAYQPYDIAPFSEGVRFFLIPYSELHGALKLH